MFWFDLPKKKTKNSNRRKSCPSRFVKGFCILYLLLIKMWMNYDLNYLECRWNDPGLESKPFGNNVNTYYIHLVVFSWYLLKNLVRVYPRMVQIRSSSNNNLGLLSSWGFMADFNRWLLSESCNSNNQNIRSVMTK